MTKINDIEKSFTDKNLLEIALTHRSYVNEHPENKITNERLEFLGDAVLEFIVSEDLFNKFKDKEEGYLTALRANLVNTVNLASVAKELKLGEHLKLSKGEEETGGRTNPSLLADTLEAIIGAIFLDSGIQNAKEFIQQNILIKTDTFTLKPLKDFKSRLQEIVQAKSLPAPKYSVVEEDGPDHNKTFTVSVLVDNKSQAKGTGKSKAEAEQKAAESALKIIASNNK